MGVSKNLAAKIERQIEENKGDCFCNEGRVRLMVGWINEILSQSHTDQTRYTKKENKAAVITDLHNHLIRILPILRQIVLQV